MRTPGCAVIVVDSDKNAATEHLLRTGRYIIGSAVGSDLPVPVGGVSRRHLQLDVLADGGVVLTDLDSSNGTRHGKRRVTAMAVTEPTRLRIGEAWLSIYPDTDQPGLIGIPQSDTIAAAGPRSTEPGAATDMPQTGWPLIAAAATMLDSIAGGQGVETSCASVMAQWSRLLGGAALRLRECGDDAALVVVGDEAARSACSTVVSLGQLRLEVDLAQGDALSDNVILALRTGLALFSQGRTKVGPPPASTADGPGEPAALPTAVITASPDVEALFGLAAKVAKGAVGVLVRGESGSGKELLAHWIHQQSARRDGPFLAINCAALPAELLESEIFGIERGVATGVDARAGLLERAKGGTVFLDELGDMALPTQAKMLRALESSTLFRVGGNRAIELDVRFVAATHRSLSKLIDEGLFRLDLYHRIAAVELFIPPLRERRADIALLATHFLASELAALRRTSPGITDDALACLCMHDWPGNVRELRNEMARAALLLQAHQPLTREHLSERVARPEPAAVDLSLESALARAETDAFAIAQAAAGADHEKAMALLKLSRSSYFRRLRAFRGVDDQSAPEQQHHDD